MRKLILIIEILLIVVIAVLALVFMTRNDALVELDLLLFKTSSIDVGMLVLLTFMFGAIIGLFVRIPDAIWRSVALKLSPSSKKSASSSSDQSKSAPSSNGSALSKGRAKAS